MGTPFLRHVSFGSGWPRGGWQCSVAASPTTERVTSGARRKSGCKSVRVKSMIRTIKTPEKEKELSISAPFAIFGSLGSAASFHQMEIH